MAGPLAPITESAAFQILIPLFMFSLALPIGLPQLLLDILLHPTQYLTYPLSTGLDRARGKFFFYCWRVLSPLTDAPDAPTKQPLLRKAYGTVLEIGAGVGDNIKYYDRSRVHRLIIVEPSEDMHPAIRTRARKAGFTDKDGSMLLLGCGGAAADEHALELAGITAGSIDTVASIHVLCGIPRPASAIEMYRRLLKPGGLLVFFEHVRSREAQIARWQSWWTRNLWKRAFDNCELDRTTGEWIIDGPGAGDQEQNTFGILDKGLAPNGTGEVSKWPKGSNGRWKEYQIEVPAEQPRNSIIPHVKGFAIKA